MPPKDEERKPPKSSAPADDAFWYKRNPSKALAGFRGLNMEQRGFYATLIELVMELRGPLPDDDVENARTFGSDLRKYRRVKAELLELERIKIEEGALFDERAVRELVRQGLFSETQERRAKTRWKKARGELKPKVVSIAGRRRAESDLGLTIGPTVAATVAPTVARNVDRTSNEINAPPDAREKRREEESSKGGTNPPKPRAARAALPLNRGGARERANVKELSDDERRAKLEEARRALLAAYPEEFAQAETPKGKEETEIASTAAADDDPIEPSDRKAKRT